MIFMDTFYAYRIFKLDQHAKENQASKGCLVFYISKADENRAAVRYRRLENSKRKRRNFASRRDAERSAEVRYAPPEKPPNF